MAPGGLLRFALCLLLGGALFYADSERGAFDELRGRMSVILAPFRAAARFPENLAAAASAHFRDREALLAERDALQAEIRKMRTRVNSLDFFAAQNDELRGMLRLRRRHEGEWIAAEVAGDGRRSSFAGRLSLDRGQRDGVLPGMAVVDELGVVGQVTRVEADASVVNLVVDGDQWLAARVRRTGALAVARGVGDGGGELSIEFMSRDADLRIGDELAADGGAYPPGYPVGQVVSVDRPEGDIHLTARVRPRARFGENRVLLVYASGAAAE